VNTGITVTATGYALGGTKAGNYTLSAQPVPGTANITAAPLTITANNANKVYGTTQSTPVAGSSAYTITAGALQNGETISSVTLTYGAGAIAATDAVGATSTITPSLPVGAGGFSASNYTITYVDGNLTVTSGVGAPTNLSYSTPVIFNAGALIEPMLPTVSGTVVTYTAASLPLGMSINATTGIISGTPSVVAAATNYTITATNTNGSTNFQISIEVQSATDPAPAPANLSYLTPVIFNSGSLIAPMLPTVTGTVTSYAVSPALPAGLSIHPTTGIISGTPTVVTAAANYMVTATNINGSTNFRVNITVDVAFIGKRTQIIIFDLLPAKAYRDAPFVLNAISTSALDVSFASTNNAVAVVSGRTVTIVGVGTTDIVATQPGDENFFPATEVVRTLVVNKKAQTINFGPLPSKNVDDPPFTVSATGGESGNPIIFSSSDTSVATCSGTNGSVITIVGVGTPVMGFFIGNTVINVGTCTIYANQAGNDFYDSAQVGQTLEVFGNPEPVGIAPKNLSYNVATIGYTVGTAISPLSPTVGGGTVTGYSVVPALPTGLILNTTTGIISGTPTTATPAINYFVTAANAFGSATCTINITVVDAVVPITISLKSQTTPIVVCENSVGDVDYALLTGIPTQYKITFDAAALIAGFKNVAYTDILANGFVTFNVIDGIPEGTYNATLQLRDAKGTESLMYPFQFTVNLSSKYIIAKFDDVVLCDNSSKRFTAYQWYKNGVAIPGATKQFYCDPNGLIGLYSLEVTDKSGKKLKTCGKTLNIPVTKKISIYPNPLNADQNCTAELIGFDLQELNGASLNIFNSAGSKVYATEQVNQVNVFKLPITPGIYIGHIVTVDGVDRVFKVIVR
jgi:hypothetical protein